MARTLKYAIQIFWAFFGLYSLLALIGMVGVLCFIDYRFVTHSTLSIELVGCLFLLPMIALLATFVYTAFVALFRFSFAVISPTVFVVSLVMSMTAVHEVVRYTQPMVTQSQMNPHLRITPFFDSMLLLVIIFGAFYFYRLTVAAIQRMLFPELNHSAARIF
jgi:hypothetical protein